MSASNPIDIIISGIRNAITLTLTGAEKVESFDPEETVTGTGQVAVEITSKEQPNPALPDWFVDISVVGMTYVSEDKDKEKILTLICDCLRSINSFTPATLSAAVPPGATLAGILPVSNTVLRYDAVKRMFTIDFRLVFVNLTF